LKDDLSDFVRWVEGKTNLLKVWGLLMIPLAIIKVITEDRFPDFLTGFALGITLAVMLIYLIVRSYVWSRKRHWMVKIEKSHIRG
jgi:hypothetical protein